MKPTRYALPISAFFLAALAAVALAQENVWVSHGPTDAAWVTDLAIADSVAYAATINGVFLSHDRGTTWRLSGLEGQRIARIAARSGADVVLADGGGGSLYVSHDRGESWAPLAGPNVFIVTIDPNDLSTIYAATSESIVKSTDAGVSWQTLPVPGPPQTFALHLGAIYLVSDRHLYKSADGGVSWASAQPPLDYTDTIAAGAMDGVVYTSGFAGGSGSLCRSADSAATWTCSATRNFFAQRIFEIPGQAPANPRLIASSFGKVFLSGDGGVTWTQAGGGFRGPLTAFASDATEALVLAGTDAEVFRTEDRGDTWTPFRAGLKAIPIGALAVDARNPSTIWAGGIGQSPSSGPGLFRSADNGVSWTPASGPQGPNGVKALLIDPENPQTIYAGGEDRVFRSDDDGATWTSSLIPGSVAPLTALAIDPTDSRRVWASTWPGSIRKGPSGVWRETGGGLFQSDRARTWRASIAQSVYSILFDERRPGTIYAGSYEEIHSIFNYPIRTGGSIFISHDYGNTFTKNTFTKSVADFGRSGGGVQSIVADPFHHDAVYLSHGGFVFRGNDRGVTLQGDGVVSIRQIVADPVRPGRLYGTSHAGVFRSEDGARTWHPFSEGLPPNTWAGLPPTRVGTGLAPVISTGPLAISPDGRWLYVGTGSAGVFARDLEAPEPCAVSATRLCLVSNRYAVDLFASRPGESQSSPGTARPLSDRAGYFGLPFATGDAELPEVVVKMLADGAFGTKGAPIFYASLTTLPYVLTVTDTITRKQEVYASNPDAPLCGGTDLPFGAQEAALMRLRSASAVTGEPALPLLGGRFSVTLEARHPRTGQITSGVAMSSGDRFGFFSLPDFTGDPQFPEVVVKMLDARAIGGKFWFFYTGLTSLDYTLTVTDSVTGAVRTYEGATQFCGAADTHAFTD